MKEELIDESDLVDESKSDTSPSDNTNANVVVKPFDNPIYGADEIKIDLGSESFGKAPREDVPSDTSAHVYEDVPVLYPPDEQDTKHVPKLNKYERL